MHPALIARFSRRITVALAAGLLACPPSFAQEATVPAPSAPAEQAKPDQGHHWDLYLSGYAFHDRDTYTEKRRKKLNEKAWGGGFGRTTRNEKGNDESFYLIGMRDSNRRPQWMAGYAHQWIYPLASSNVEAGIGYSALLMKRDDWFDGQPFPALLPVGSIGTQRLKLLATYVPRLSTRKGKGNVLLFVARVSF